MKSDQSSGPNVFYVPGDVDKGIHPSIIDTVLFCPFNNRYEGLSSKKSLDETAKEHPGVRVGNLFEVMDAKRDMYRREFVEIDEQSFVAARDGQPPMDWHQLDGGECFKLSERLFDNITTIFCSLGNRYFRFNDLVSLRGADLAARVKLGMEALRLAAERAAGH